MMKTRILPVAAAIALGLTACLQASTLSAEMKSMGRSFKALKEMVKTNTYDFAKIEASVKTSRESVKKCADQVPDTVAKLDEAAKKTALESYKKQMATLDAAYVKLGDAASKKDPVAVKSSFDELRDIMKKGHEEFRKDDD
jgi:cytochrome c556